MRLRPSAAGPSALPRTWERRRVGWAIAALLAAAASWTVVSGAVTGGQSGPMVGLLLGAGGAFVLARIASAASPLIVAGVVVAVVGAMAVGSAGDLLAQRAVGGPLGYTNANAALFVQGAVAALALVKAVRWAPGRVLAVALAAGFALATIASSSLAADLLLALPLVAAIAGRIGRARLAISGFRTLFLAALIVTTFLGAASLVGGIGVGGDPAEESRTGRRVTLWGEALDLIWDHPVVGVGPDRFKLISPTARVDADARWAHNEFLQFGAETGVLGLLLLVLAFLEAFRHLRRMPQPDMREALGAAALAALGIHACVDYVLHFPAVTLAGAALVGAATSSRPKLVRGGE